MSPEDHANDLAKRLANNHAKFESFGWSTRRELDRPEDYAIVYTSNRDSDALARSNEHVILTALKPFMGWHGDGAHCWTESHGHWAVGHADCIVIRVYDATTRELTPAFKAYAELATALEDYPVLDEEDYSEREQADAELTWKNCYNDRQRLEYMRSHWREFEHCHAKWYPANEAWRNLLDCVRGRAFYGYASELLA
jgi:hypothetical protein